MENRHLEGVTGRGMCDERITWVQMEESSGFRGVFDFLVFQFCFNLLQVGSDSPGWNELGCGKITGSPTGSTDPVPIVDLEL